MDDQIGGGELLDDALGRERRRSRWASRADPGDCLAEACCSSFDGSCLVGLIGACFGLVAAIAGGGRTGSSLRYEARAPRGSVAAALYRGVRYYQLRISARRSGYGGCRYTPTCSAYAAEALRRHGAWEGSRLAARRLWRCRPGLGGGMDQVP